MGTDVQAGFPNMWQYFRWILNNEKHPYDHLDGHECVRKNWKQVQRYWKIATVLVSFTNTFGTGEQCTKGKLEGDKLREVGKICII